MTPPWPPRDALTVRQPYAHALVTGRKTVENRAWHAPRRVLGRWLAIHAATAIPVLTDELLELWPDAPDEYDCGAVIGAVLVVESVAWRADLGPWATGPVCWRVAAAVELSTPYECRGRLSIWPAPIEAFRGVDAPVLAS